MPTRKLRPQSELCTLLLGTIAAALLACGARLLIVDQDSPPSKSVILAKMRARVATFPADPSRIVCEKIAEYIDPPFLRVPFVGCFSIRHQEYKATFHFETETEPSIAVFQRNGLQWSWNR